MTVNFHHLMWQLTDASQLLSTDPTDLPNLTAINANSANFCLYMNLSTDITVMIDMVDD